LQKSKNLPLARISRQAHLVRVQVFLNTRFFVETDPSRFRKNKYLRDSGALDDLDKFID